MSISGVSENSSSNTNSLSDSSYFENNNPVDNSSSDNTPTQKDINNTQTSLEQMASQPTIGEKIASELTTAEQLSGQTFGITATKPEQTNIHLAGGLFPDIVQQELQQQLQPLSNALENAMAPPNPETMTPMGVVSYWATGSASNGDLSFSPNSVMSQTFSQGNGAAAFEDFVYQKFDGNPKAGDTVVNFDYTFTAGRFAYTGNRFAIGWPPTTRSFWH